MYLILINVYYRRNRPFKLYSEFRVQEMKGRLLFMHFLKDLHEKQSAFRFLDSEFRVQFEKPTAFIIKQLLINI